MADRGTIKGYGAEIAWTPFTPGAPLLRAFSLSGTPTQPLLGSATTAAHFLYERQSGLVTYSGVIQFASDTTFGTGDVWGIRLPVPAYRSLGGADLPIGSGWAWQGTAGNRNMKALATLMDPLGVDGNETNEDYFAQFFIPNNLATGATGDANTPAFGSGGTTSVVTHGLGTTPSLFDIDVVLTNAASTAPGEVFVTSVGSTTFTVNVRSSSTTTPQTFSWKVRAEPNGSSNFDLLINAARPFQGGWASGYVLGWDLQYQARR